MPVVCLDQLYALLPDVYQNIFFGEESTPLILGYLQHHLTVVYDQGRGFTAPAVLCILRVEGFWEEKP
jgi:hypothetical protein